MKPALQRVQFLPTVARGPLPILRYQQVEGANSGPQSCGLVAVAVAGAGSTALVGSRSYVLGHLRFEHLLEHSLDDFAQKARIVEQVGKSTLNIWQRRGVFE